MSENGNGAPEGKDLTAADILASMDRRLVAMFVPEWNGRVYLRTLSAAESLELQEKLSSAPKEQPFEQVYLMLAACVANAKGEALFATEEDRKQLATRDQAVLLRLQKLVAEHMGVVVTEKNASGGAAGAASPSA